MFCGMRHLVLIPILLVSISVSACGPGARTGDRPRAIEHYIEGAEAYRAGDAPAARDHLSTAVQQNPDLIMARMLLGDLFYQAGDHETAVEHYELAARRDPYWFPAHYRLGRGYQLLNRFQQAAATYLHALSLRPEDAAANMNLGLVFLSLNEPGEALEHIERAAELNPNSAAAFANLGVALDSVGEHSRAEAAYLRALELDPQMDATLLNLGINLQLQGRASDSIRTLEQYLERGESAVGRKRYGDALSMANRRDEAAQQYRRALELNPRYVAALNALAEVLIAQYRASLELDDEKRQEAVLVLERSLELNAEQPRVRALREEFDRPAF
jgi:tetratricopeptide (TPR) repeat protein